MLTAQEFLSFMDTNGFVYQRMEHPAVFTCAEAELHRSKVPAVSTKNLFLCDKKARRFFLMVTAFTSIADQFRDLGLSTVTVQRKDITHEEISNLFWINVTAGLMGDPPPGRREMLAKMGDMKI